MTCKIARDDRLRNERNIYHLSVFIKEDKCYVITFDPVKSFRQKTSTPKVKVIL